MTSIFSEEAWSSCAMCKRRWQGWSLEENEEFSIESMTNGREGQPDPT